MSLLTSIYTRLSALQLIPTSILHFYISSYRLHRLRLRAVALLRGRRRVPGLLQRLRPQLAPQRADQVERGDQETPTRRARRPLRHGRRFEVSLHVGEYEAKMAR